MSNVYSNVACGGMDVHYKFSNVTLRDSAGNVVRRERLDYPERAQLQERNHELNYFEAPEKELFNV